MLENALRLTGRMIVFVIIGFVFAYVVITEMLATPIAQFPAAVMSDPYTLLLPFGAFTIPWTMAFLRRVLAGITIFGNIVVFMILIVLVYVVSFFIGWACLLWELFKLIRSWVKFFKHRKAQRLTN